MKGKIWAKLYKKNKIVSDYLVESKNDIMLDSMEKICKFFDISVPMWTKDKKNNWDNFGIAKFNKDDFIDKFDYDILEINFISDKN